MTECTFDRRQAEQLRQVVAQSDWTGTPAELHTILIETVETEIPSPAHLGRWLRRNEPTLWWDFGVRVRFSRTDRARYVHLSRRGWLKALNRW